jgi:hypothetical protein
LSKCSDCDIELVEHLPGNPPVHTRRKAEADNPELVVIREYPTTIDAELAKSALESVGIESMIRSDDKGGQSPGLAFGRGVELLVRADDVDAADDILNVEGIEGHG